ncbi:MAG: carboxypeptidase-like regulatory domain-containing protein, partial [Planctomycetota bacterium]
MSSRANRARLVIRQGVLAICSLPLVAGTPQEKTLRRERLVGRIRDLAQQPWPGARVFLMSRPVPGLDRVGDADEVETKTDGRGRFRAMLLPGRSYTAWAAGAAETGRYRRTRTVENVHAGRPVRLEEADEAGIRSRCRISGREAWGEGLRFELVVDTENRHVLAVKPDARGELEFPMLPEGRLFLEMYGSEGIPLFGTELSGSIETREIPLPTPCSVLVRVLDRGGRAVAGANIYRQTRQGRVWQRIAVSGADGFASILLPGARSSGDGTVRVRAALRADSPAHALGRIATSVGLQTHRDLSKLRASRQPDITLRLWPGLSVKGRILVDESRPAAGLPLLVYGPIVRGKSSWTHP